MRIELAQMREQRTIYTNHGVDRSPRDTEAILTWSQLGLPPASGLRQDAADAGNGQHTIDIRTG
jgi:hypothetical protein